MKRTKEVLMEQVAGGLKIIIGSTSSVECSNIFTYVLLGFHRFEALADILAEI